MVVFQIDKFGLWQLFDIIVHVTDDLRITQICIDFQLSVLLINSVWEHSSRIVENTC